MGWVAPWRESSTLEEDERKGMDGWIEGVISYRIEIYKREVEEKIFLLIEEEETPACSDEDHLVSPFSPSSSSSSSSSSSPSTSPSPSNQKVISYDFY